MVVIQQLVCTLTEKLVVVGSFFDPYIIQFSIVFSFTTDKEQVGRAISFP